MMPKATFFNLSEEKRQKIIEAAVSEFAKKNYHQASINSIVRAASIPKGSFYQYFGDKKDLYRHIINLAYHKKMEIMARLMADKGEENIFSLLRNMIDAGVEMAKTNPELSQITSRMMSDRPLYKEIMDEYEERSFEFMKELVNKGVAQGDITDRIDPKLATRFVLMAMRSITEEVSASGDTGLDRVSETLHSFVDIIENGLRRRTT